MSPVLGFVRKGRKSSAWFLMWSAVRERSSFMLMVNSGYNKTEQVKNWLYIHLVKSSSNSTQCSRNARCRWHRFAYHILDKVVKLHKVPLIAVPADLRWRGTCSDHQRKSPWFEAAAERVSEPTSTPPGASLPAGSAPHLQLSWSLFPSPGQLSCPIERSSTNLNSKKEQKYKWCIKQQIITIMWSPGQ